MIIKNEILFSHLHTVVHRIPGRLLGLVSYHVSDSTLLVELTGEVQTFDWSLSNDSPFLVSCHGY